MKAVLFAAAAFAALTAAAPAHAKLACYHLKLIEQALDAEYGEKPAFTGRESKAGESIEYRLYVNAATGSWSWVGIPAGTEVGCLVFAGTTPDKQGKPQAGDPANASSSPSAPDARF